MREQQMKTFIQEKASSLPEDIQSNHTYPFCENQTSYNLYIVTLVPNLASPAFTPASECRIESWKKRGAEAMIILCTSQSSPLVEIKAQLLGVV